MTDFETFYTNSLLPHMERFKQEYRSQYQWLFAAIGSFVIFIGVIISKSELLTDPPLIPIGSFIMFIVSIIKFSNSKSLYVSDFKETVMKHIIEQLNPGMIYKPDHFIPEKEVTASSLYRLKYDFFNGEDLIEGTFRNIRFHCSEIFTSTRDSNGFRALFLTAAISKRYNGGTYVWDKDFEQLPVSIYDEHYRMNTMPRVVRVKTADPVFNKYFSVCSTNPQQSADILTADRVHRLSVLRTRLNAPVAFSFVAGRCFVSVTLKQNYLEPGMQRPDNKHLVAKYYDTVVTILYILEQLDLQGLC